MGRHIGVFLCSNSGGKGAGRAEGPCVPEATVSTGFMTGLACPDVFWRIVSSIFKQLHLDPWSDPIGPSSSSFLLPGAAPPPSILKSSAELTLSREKTGVAPTPSGAPGLPNKPRPRRVSLFSSSPRRAVGASPPRSWQTCCCGYCPAWPRLPSRLLGGSRGLF